MVKKSNFGWTKKDIPELSMNDPINRRIYEELMIQQERQNIYDNYIQSAVFLTGRAGRLYQQYRNLDWEVVNIEFLNPNYPLIPTLTLVHTVDDPRNPDNVIIVHLELLNENMLR